MSRQIRRLAFVIVGTIAAAALVVGCVPRPSGGGEICDDLIDNDNDLATDCADSDCAAHPACNVTPGDEICDNGIDDDDDSLIDCADLVDCATATNCASEDCDDGLDNDGDGAVDCDDTDCTGALGCGAEVCDDGVDNDGDGLVDCIDTDCFQFCIPEDCENGNDDDSDGLTDCDDEECATTFHACIPEICNDGMDNDFDLDADCADDECLMHTDCIDEICDDGMDNDFDTDVDCADSECATTFSDCVPEICDNGTDDDFDMDVDCLDSECFMDVACYEFDCSDGLDNDTDGLADCSDPDCDLVGICLETDCTDGVDNDGNGLTDCADPDCAGNPTCTAAGIYELFTAFDMNGAMLEFTPDGGGFYTYMAMSNPSGLPETAGAGTVSAQVLSLTDDSNTLVTFGLTIPFFAANYNSFYVGSNGYITFITGDTDYTESVADFFDGVTPRIAMYWDDLNPSSGGTVQFDEYIDRVVVTFTGVPEYSSTGSNTFQAVIYSTGVITIYWSSMTSSDSLVGICDTNPFSLPDPPAVNFL